MNIGILGAGHIAGIMTGTLQKMKDVKLYAVAARNYDRAETFAKKYGADKAYGSYRELAEDKNVDLIYIATPHSHHYEHIKLCLEYDKNVLCEKAFTINAAQAKEVYALAEKKGVLLTEAIWTRYMPMRGIIMDVLNTGVIGTPYMLTANLGYVAANKERIKYPELAGGALLDLGVYPLNFASMIFGDDISSLTGMATFNEYGVDTKESIIMTYRDGKMASLTACVEGVSDRHGVIYGDKGLIVVDNINNFEGLSVYNLRRELVKHIDAPKQITGYEYEILSSINAIKEGRTECIEMPHKESILMMEWMDSLRKQWNMVYPMEKG